MRTSVAVILFAALGWASIPPSLATDAASRPVVSPLWAAGVLREGLPSGLRGQKGDEDLLDRRVPEVSPFFRAARNATAPAAASLRQGQMRGNTGQARISGGCSRL